MWINKDQDNYDELLDFCMQHKDELKNHLGKLLVSNSLSFLNFNEFMHFNVVLFNTKFQKSSQDNFSFNVNFFISR